LDVSVELGWISIPLETIDARIDSISGSGDCGDCEKHCLIPFVEVNEV
jgi:hypothetical protein